MLTLHVVHKCIVRVFVENAKMPRKAREVNCIAFLIIRILISCYRLCSSINDLGYGQAFRARITTGQI
jgi:hypothetical protein